MTALTVTQLVEAINISLTDLAGVIVEGEVSEFRIIHNKWVTFQLKDATSSVGCFMTVWQYKTAIEDGMKVRATGQPNLRNKGFFSFVLTDVQPAGEGALKRALELLRAKLTAEGLFVAERKRALPRFPEHIALITSKDAAAYSDFLKVLEARHGGLTISFIHTQVQGAEAPGQLKAALEYANSQLPVDVIVMVRGGGSLEDLQAFNDESVIRAVATSRIPTIVGIGHERDITLAELAADVRASTPSNAAELLIQSQSEISLAITQLEGRLTQRVRDHLSAQQQHINRGVYIMRTRAREPQQRVARYLETLHSLGQRLHHTARLKTERLARLHQILAQDIRQTVDHRGEALEQVTRILQTLSPAQTLKRGYSIARQSNGQLLRSVSQTKSQAEISIQVADGTISSTVTDIALS